MALLSQISSLGTEENMKTHKLFIAFAAFFGLLAVIIGALVAHATDLNSSGPGLQSLNTILAKFCAQCSNLSEQSLAQINTAVQYQFYHVPALLGIGILTSLHRNYDSLLLKLSGIAFILGILQFSGSLYANALTDNPFFTKFTPFGGISFIFAWLLLFLYALTKTSHFKENH